MKKSLRGAFTVEAVFIIPFVIFVMMALLYLSFYIHDKAVIQSVLDQMLVREGQQLCHPTDISTGEVKYEMIDQRSLFYLISYNKNSENEKIENYVKGRLNHRLCMSKVESLKGNMNREQIKITVQVKMGIPFLPAKTYLEDILKYQIVVKGEAYNPMKFSWRADGLLDAVDDTEIYKKIKNYLK